MTWKRYSMSNDIKATEDDGLTEFFIVANSFAAPLVSDTSEHFIRAIDAGTALVQFIPTYKHPSGLYSARVYTDANAYHKREKHLGEFLSDEAKKVWA